MQLSLIYYNHCITDIRSGTGTPMRCSPRWIIALQSAEAQCPMQQSGSQVWHFQGADPQVALQMVSTLNSIGLRLLWFFRHQKRVIGGHEKVGRTNLSVSNFTHLAENSSDITSVFDIAWISCLLLSYNNSKSNRTKAFILSVGR